MVHGRAPRLELPPKVLKTGALDVMLDYATRLVTDVGLEGELRAAAVQLLHDVSAAGPPEDYDPLPYIEAQVWTTARSGDHDYVVISKSTDWRAHLVFIRWLRVWGQPEKFNGRIYPYRDIGTHHYWAMADLTHTIANRRRLDP